MKTDDRDERLASILDEAVHDVGGDAREAPAAEIRGIGRAARALSAAAAAVFVAGVVFASGQFGRDSRPGDDGTGTVTEGLFETDRWQLERPSDWITAPFDGCGTELPRGLIVSNVEFEFLNPEGQVPSCNERMVFAGFPSGGVVIDLEPEGGRVLFREPPADTPFPIEPRQLIPTDGIVGGPRMSLLNVYVEERSTATVRLWVGSDASTGDVEAAHQILRSMRFEGADRWIDEEFEFDGFPVGKSHGVRVGLTRPEDWEVEAYKRVVVIDAPNPIVVLTSPLTGGDTFKACGPVVFIVSGVAPRLSSTGVAISVSDASESWSYPKLGSRWDVLDPSSATTDRIIECRGQTFRWLQWAFAVERRPILVDVLMSSSAQAELSAVGWTILESLRFPKTPTPSQPAELPSPVRDFRSEFVSDERGYRVWPTSGQVDPDVVYRFAAPHCGLDWLVDFDGSFWEPTYPIGDKPDYAINSDIGTMTLVGPDEATYVASDGSQVSLLRIDRPVVTHLCG